VKRHEILKQLSVDLPKVEFVSVGGLIDAEKSWYNRFQENCPPNYSLKTNLPGLDLLKILQDSRLYVHLMEGEHFGITPVEGLASGCITLVHNSGGMKEFVPEEYRWDNYEDLKAKIVKYMEMDDSAWGMKHKPLWSKISALTPQIFENEVWSKVATLFD
jgi:glycosyltransferase involved in cell wall biosynthesis